MAFYSNLTPACMASGSSEEFSYPDPPTTSPPPDNKRNKRKYHKCEQCRNDRKSCSLETYNLNPGQKCARCNDLGHDCGPPVKARGKKSIPTLPGDMRMPPSINSSPYPSTAVDTQPLDQTMPTLNQGYGRVSHGIVVNAVLQGLFKRARSDLDATMNFDRATLPNILSTPTYHLGQDLRSDISAQRNVLRDNPLCGINAFEPQRRTTPMTLPDVVQSVDSTSGEFVAVICTQNVLGLCEPIGSQPRGHIRNSVNELDQRYYLSAEAEFKQYMLSLPRAPFYQWRTPQFRDMSNCDPFPASHLAYMNLDRENAFKLWQITAWQGPTDVLGRSFPHIVAEAGDSNLLDRMDPVFLRAADRDGRGLSLLDLAVMGDSFLIVRTVIENSIVPPPFTQAMQIAIIAERLEIASLLLPHLARGSNRHELNTLANLANRSGFQDLELGLRSIELIEPNPQDALDSLDALGSLLQSDDPVIFTSAWPDHLGVPDRVLPPDLSYSQNLFDNSEYNSSRSPQADPEHGTHNYSCWQPYPPY